MFINMIKGYNQEFLVEDLETNEKVHLFFRSKGCKPCKQIELDILDFAENYDKIVYIVESNEARDLQKQYRVAGYPTMVILQGDKVLYNALGPQKIKELM